MPEVSIIVPVYNAQKNLERCIESVLKQDYEDFELILMDDGSGDNSGSICDSYALKDKRIRVVHKENSGVSDTRNLAMEMAQGEYLQFLDSDDWITPDATGLMVRMAKEHHSEMVITDFYRVIGERLAHKGDIREDGLLSREEFALYMMENPADFYYGVLWNKLYRRDIIMEYGLRMDKNISWCEDFIFNMEYIRHVNYVYALHVPVYYYVKTPGSLVSQGTSITKTIQMKRTVFQCYNEFYKDIFKEEDYEKRRIQVYRFLVAVAGDGSVMPSIMPSAMKLGNERVSVSGRITKTEGIFSDIYREGKLLERYLQTVALRHDLRLSDVKLLLYFSQTQESGNLKEIAAITHLKKTKVLLSLQKLMSREILKIKDNPKYSTYEKDKSANAVENGDFLEAAENQRKGVFEIFKEENTKKDKKEKKAVKRMEKDEADKIEVEFLEKAEDVLQDILLAQDMFYEVKYAGLSEEEIEQYEALSEKIKENVQKSLK